jgi:butyryl-CoA dehydrogenase
LTDTEEQALIRDLARKFATDHLKPHSSLWDRNAAFPETLASDMGTLGFFGMLVPEKWGGAGMSYRAYAAVLEELAAGDGSITTVISVQMLVNNILAQRGSGDQKERWLRPLAQGRAISAFGLTEPHAGSDASSLKTKAVRAVDGWIINGAKQFISNGAVADVVLVFAVTDAVLGARGISAFLVPTDTAGFTCARKEDKMGQRACDTTFLTFDNVHLADTALVGKENQGYKYALENLEAGRIGIAAQSLGMARAAYEAALSYSKERESFGKPISQHQAVAFRLADMATSLEAARQLIRHAATLRDHGQPCLKEAAMAKLFATEMAEKICHDAIQIHGGYGYIRDYGVEQIYRDVRVTSIYEGTSDIQKMLISRAILKP